MKDRGEYRSIYAVLVDTREFQDLPADARLLWYTLKMSLGALGIGTAYDEQLEMRSGLSRSRFLAARRELERGGRWLAREGLVHWLRNSLRFEPNISLANENHRAFIARTLLGLPKSALVNRFALYYELPIPFPSYGDGMSMGSGGDGGSHVDGMSNPSRPHEMSSPGDEMIPSGSHVDGMGDPMSIHPLNLEPPQNQEPTPKEKASLRSAQKKARPPGSPRALNGAHPGVEPDRFAEAWAAYPKRSGSNPRHAALRAWNARIRDGTAPAAMLAGVERYRDFIEAKGDTGTEFVMQAARFFGPGHEWENDWEAPAGNGGKDDDDLGGWRGMTDADVARINADLV